MTNSILRRIDVPANLSKLALGLTVAAGVAIAGAPAMAAGSANATTSVEQQATSAGQSAQVSAQTLLRIAESQIGVRENAAGGGTPYHNWYMSSPRAAETLARDGGGHPHVYANAPWCAMFVSWVGEKAGARHAVGWDAYTVAHAKWFKDNGRWGTQAKPGALVFFDWAGGESLSGIDHVGLVKKDNGDGTITTIEGNTGNGKVEQRVRPTSQVAGYGYPALPG